MRSEMLFLFEIEISVVRIGSKYMLWSLHHVRLYIVHVPFFLLHESVCNKNIGMLQ